MVDAARLRNAAESLGFTKSTWWPQFENEWQQQEQDWKNRTKAEWIALRMEFIRRDRELRFETIEALNAENQWRNRKRDEMVEGWSQLSAQRAQGLQARIEQLVNAENNRVENLENQAWTLAKDAGAEPSVHFSTQTSQPIIATSSLVQNLVDQRGLVTQIKHDAKGNVVEKTITGNLTGEEISETATAKFAYNPNNLLTSIIDPLGNEVAAFYEDSSNPQLPTRIEYKTQGQIVSSIRNTYGVGGLLLKQQIAADTADEATVEYTYNEQGLVSSQRRITGNSDPDVLTQFEYNSRGELTKEIDGLGITLYIHDAEKKQTRIERRDRAGNLLASQLTHYNDRGQPNRIDQIRSNSASHLLEYDGAGLLKSWQIPGNQSEKPYSIAYKHDPLGNLTEVSHPNGHLTKMTYDPKGQMLSHSYQDAIDSSKLHNERFTYGPGGDVVTYTDPDGAEIKYSYTTDGKLCRQENPDGTVQQWRYGLDGRLIKEIESDGSYWETSYNDIERTITRVRKDSSHATLNQERYSFDRRGNVISYTDGQGKTFTREYDQLNRLKTESGPSGWNHISYGRNTLMLTNHLGEKQIFTKDAWGRITKIVNEAANSQKISETTYTYSLEKNSITATKGSKSTTILFDDLGQPVLVKQSDANEGFWKRLWNATLGHPRVQGTLLAAGGMGESALGTALLLTPEPTGLTKIGGGALFLHGADLTAAGLKQLWINQSVQTFTVRVHPTFWRCRRR